MIYAKGWWHTLGQKNGKGYRSNDSLSLWDADESVGNFSWTSPGMNTHSGWKGNRKRQRETKVLSKMPQKVWTCHVSYCDVLVPPDPIPKEGSRKLVRAVFFFLAQCNSSGGVWALSCQSLGCEFLHLSLLSGPWTLHHRIIYCKSLEETKSMVRSKLWEELSSLWREWAGRRNAWGRGKNILKSRKTGQNTGRLEIEIPPWPRGLSFCEGISCLCQTDRRQGSYPWQDWLITIVEHLHSKRQAIIKTLLHFKMEFPLPRYRITSICKVLQDLY